MIAKLVLGTAAVSAPLVIAQASPAAEDASLELAKAVFKAVELGDWRLAAAFALIGVVAFCKWLAPKLHNSVGAFLNGDAGGSVLVLLASFGSALSTARMAGQSWTWAVARTAGEVALSAAGGYSLLKKLLMPLITKLWAKVSGK